MSEKKSILVAYAFFFFFGVFGIHRFYLDKHWTGLLWLLTGGFFFVGLIYDFFAIPFYVFNANK